LPVSLYDTALVHVQASRLTDAEFIYTPSQIALASMSLAAPDTVTKWAETKVSLESRPSVSSVIESIGRLIVSSGLPPDVESVREVDRRLRICKNPEKVPGTKAYVAKGAETERLVEEKRARKIEEVQKSIAADPFGEELKNEAQRPGLVDYDDDDD
jgi:cyclin H